MKQIYAQYTKYLLSYSLAKSAACVVRQIYKMQ